MIENLSQIHVKRHSKTERKELCFVEIEVCHYHERCEKKSLNTYTNSSSLLR